MRDWQKHPESLVQHEYSRPNISRWFEKMAGSKNYEGANIDNLRLVDVKKPRARTGVSFAPEPDEDSDYLFPGL